jgi:hypothetical protein
MTDLIRRRRSQDLHSATHADIEGRATPHFDGVKAAATMDAQSGNKSSVVTWVANLHCCPSRGVKSVSDLPAAGRLSE